MGSELIVENVRKRYRNGTEALRGIDLRLTPGVLGLLGPNGAGKSTLMRILATVSRPSSGQVTWNGRDLAEHPDELRAVLGYLPQDFGVYPHLTAVELLRYLAAAKGLARRHADRRIEELLHLVRLTDVRHRAVGGYSGGMRQRLGIAQSLLNDPELLIVDEPTVGLDPEERVRFRHLLSDLGRDRIVVLSTHIVPDVEAAAHSIALIQAGEVLRRGSPEELLRGLEGSVWSTVVAPDELDGLRARHLVSNVLRRSDGVAIRIVAREQPTAGSETVPATLEEVYLEALATSRRGDRAEPAP
jgi:ABC-type multidrug transport system ATPase subunit